jgi:hypothetical protein
MSAMFVWDGPVVSAHIRLLVVKVMGLSIDINHLLSSLSELPSQTL